MALLGRLWLFLVTVFGVGQRLGVVARYAHTYIPGY